MINEIASYLHLKDMSVLAEVVQKSFQKEKLGTKLVIDSTSLNKSNKALFCSSSRMALHKTSAMKKAIELFLMS